MAGRRAPGAPTLLAPLAAPIVWAVCFFAVYLFAEAACAAGGLRWAGADAVVVFTLAAIGVGLAATVASAWWSWRAGRMVAGHGGVADQRRLLSAIGIMLGVLFATTLVAMAVPALVHGSC